MKGSVYDATGGVFLLRGRGLYLRLVCGELDVVPVCCCLLGWLSGACFGVVVFC